VLGLDPALGVLVVLLRDPEDGEPFLAVLLLKLVEVRNCTPTGVSPEGEELDQDGSASEVIERLRLGLTEVGELDLWKLATGVGARDEKRERRNQQAATFHDGMPSWAEERG
jgi:hypothetical protein